MSINGILSFTITISDVHSGAVVLFVLFLFLFSCAFWAEDEDEVAALFITGAIGMIACVIVANVTQDKMKALNNDPDMQLNARQIAGIVATIEDRHKVYHVYWEDDDGNTYCQDVAHPDKVAWDPFVETVTVECNKYRSKVKRVILPALLLVKPGSEEEKQLVQAAEETASLQPESSAGAADTA